MEGILLVLCLVDMHPTILQSSRAPIASLLVHKENLLDCYLDFCFVAVLILFDLRSYTLKKKEDTSDGDT